MQRCHCHDWPCNWSEIDKFHQEYRIEVNRTRSFFINDINTIWPLDYPKPAVMSRAGFFYTGFWDLVRCFECCVLIGDWTIRAMDPMTVHGMNSRSCRYARGLPCGDMKLYSEISTVDSMLRTHNDVMLMYRNVIQTNMRMPGINNVSSDNSGSTRIVNDVTVSQCPQYACYGDRLLSFNTWPVTKVQTMKEAMSCAGFYYTGDNDKTQCYHCGLELWDWKPEDDPLLQHIKYFSKCTHIMTVHEKESSIKTS